jgi:membrane-bound lytic murein transglycosylase A
LQASQFAALPGWSQTTPADLAASFAVFEKSCKSLAKEPSWQRVCAGTPWKRLSGEALRAWVEDNFVPHQAINADGTATGLFTGYYEPVLNASRVRRAPYLTPIYGVPDDLITIDIGEVYPELKNQRVRGRLDASGKKIIPYAARSEIDAGVPKLRGKELFYLDDPIEAFFLEVQGSGRLVLTDGSVTRVNYADQNGHAYRSIGRWLVDQGQLAVHEASMQGIKDWVARNPARLRELLAANPSYVFFREIKVTAQNTNDGPLGALGVPLTAEVSMAVDRTVVPLGAPVYLATTYPLSERPLQKLMVAQDTGGAIRGGVRGDFYWGSGPEAGKEAGRMRSQGSMWVLLPRQ